MTFLPDSVSEESSSTSTLTYRDLHDRVAELAGRIAAVGQPGDRAVLLFPPGLDFLIGFIAAQVAGRVPVPTSFPKPGRVMPRLDSAATDCRPTILLTDQSTAAGIDPQRVCQAVRDAQIIAVDSPDDSTDADPAVAIDAAVPPDSLALLQYTSGSTSEPKGVRISHANLMANLEQIRRTFDLPFESDDAEEPLQGVFWLPPYHDMGLIGGILEPLYVGGHAILMSPRQFLSRPIAWLRAIDHFGAQISGAPDFAYRLCVDRIDPAVAETLDLSRWTLAFCGAEPISTETLDRFTERFGPSGFGAGSFLPCYGMAEATLLATGGPRSLPPARIMVDVDAIQHDRIELADPAVATRTQTLVSCGQPAMGMSIQIVDRAGGLLGENRIGEILLAGPSVCDGYWERPELTGAMFVDVGGRAHLRTGDLGCLHNGELYVTGRLKDLLILRGRNLYPQDIEAVVRAAGAELPGGPIIQQVVAVGTPTPRGEALVLIVEIDRHADVATFEPLVRQIRQALLSENELDAQTIVLARPGAISLTTSGKVQRGLTGQSLADQTLTPWYRWDRPGFDNRDDARWPRLSDSVRRVVDDNNAGNPVESLAHQRASQSATTTVQRWLTVWLQTRTGQTSHPDLQRPLADFGLDSLAAVELSGELEDWLGLELSPVVAWNHPTPAKLSSYLAERLVGPAPDDSPEDDSTADDSPDDELARLLAEVESMSDAEADAALADEDATAPRRERGPGSGARVGR